MRVCACGAGVQIKCMTCIATRRRLLAMPACTLKQPTHAHHPPGHAAHPRRGCAQPRCPACPWARRRTRLGPRIACKQRGAAGAGWCRQRRRQRHGAAARRRACALRPDLARRSLSQGHQSRRWAPWAPDRQLLGLQGRACCGQGRRQARSRPQPLGCTNRRQHDRRIAAGRCEGLRGLTQTARGGFCDPNRAGEGDLKRSKAVHEPATTESRGAAGGSAPSGVARGTDRAAFQSTATPPKVMYQLEGSRHVHSE